jgi:hypothetical protein
MFEVPDDSGFLGIFDPDAYVSFVQKDWELEQLFRHFSEQMKMERLLLWGTGREGWWRVEVDEKPCQIVGFRDTVGPIAASAGRLCLTHYESLTMGASYSHVTLPEPYEQKLLLTVPAGRYNCRIVQVADPMDFPETGPDFVLQLSRTDQPVAPWQKVMWAPRGLPG